MAERTDCTLWERSWEAGSQGYCLPYLKNRLSQSAWRIPLKCRLSQWFGGGPRPRSPYKLPGEANAAGPSFEKHEAMARVCGEENKMGQGHHTPDSRAGQHRGDPAQGRPALPLGPDGVRRPASATPSPSPPPPPSRQNRVQDALDLREERRPVSTRAAPPPPPLLFPPAPGYAAPPPASPPPPALETSPFCNTRRRKETETEAELSGKREIGEERLSVIPQGSPEDPVCRIRACPWTHHSFIH